MSSSGLDLAATARGRARLIVFHEKAGSELRGRRLKLSNQVHQVIEMERVCGSAIRASWSDMQQFYEIDWMESQLYASDQPAHHDTPLPILVSLSSATFTAPIVGASACISRSQSASLSCSTSSTPTARTLAGSTPTMVAVCTTAFTLPPVERRYCTILLALVILTAAVDPGVPAGVGRTADQYCRRNSVAAL